LIFLDIQLTDGTGFQILEKTNTSIPIIFVTAFNNYALDAFKYTSIDYLLKPIDKKELSKSIDKFKQFFNNKETHLNKYEDLIQFFNKKTTRILGIRGKSKYPILIEDIAYFYIEDRIVWIIKNDGSKYYINKNLDELESELNSAVFFRANRKTIVSISSITKMETASKARIKVFVQPPVRFDIMVSTENTPKFKNWVISS
jgi:two-component system response regulator LytT